MDQASFAGFTPAIYTGALGGRNGAHAICDAAFPGSHFCHAAEFTRSNTSAVPPANGAWVDQSVAVNNNLTIHGVPNSGRQNNAGCNNWTSGASNSTWYMVNPADSTIVGGNCSIPRALACCDGESTVEFAGFTSQNAPMTGRPGLHAACDAEFPGSHMCHAAEYHRANASQPVPASGAWVDQSVTQDGTLTVHGPPNSGRLNTAGCNNWTSTASNSSWYMVSADGTIIGGNCSIPRKVACCM